MIAPVVNQNAFLILNWLIKNSGSSMHGYGLFHSLGHNRPMIKSATETPKYAVTNNAHTSMAKGSAKEKKLGGALLGFW